MILHKYHGLGNDYFVLDPKDEPIFPSREGIQKICHRNYGLGSDGILYGPLPSQVADFRLEIWNPDGSQAEKSGNGLRIFSQYLFDSKHVTTETFTVETLGGIVTCQVHGPGDIEVAMGQATFLAERIPVKGLTGEALDKEIEIEGKSYLFHAASVGNPHCIIPVSKATRDQALTLGPVIENHHYFPNRTNVQFLEVIDKENIKIEIYERGAGYTLASGSSSCAAAAVAFRKGLVGNKVAVHMPGGALTVTIQDDFFLTQRGLVERVGKLVWNSACRTVNES